MTEDINASDRLVDRRSLNTIPEAVPLTVDLDGTLLQRDSLWDMSFAAIRSFDIFFPFSYLWGRPNFKYYLATHHAPDFGKLAVNTSVLEIMAEARAQGRPVWLVTAASEVLAERAAKFFGFDNFKGSPRNMNLRGAEKAAWLVDKFGLRGFDYMGDSAVDMPVWAASRVAYVASSFRDLDSVRAVCDDVRVFMTGGESANER